VSEVSTQVEEIWPQPRVAQLVALAGVQGTGEAGVAGLVLPAIPMDRMAGDGLGGRAVDADLGQPLAFGRLHGDLHAACEQWQKQTQEPLHCVLASSSVHWSFQLSSKL
jgi:hypothetical protein